MIVSVLEWSAWIISAGLGAWMLVDAIRTSQNHSEEFLTTSVEGTDELLETEHGTRLAHEGGAS
jgi:hypothetical protein